MNERLPPEVRLLDQNLRTFGIDQDAQFRIGMDQELLGVFETRKTIGHRLIGTTPIVYG